MKRPVVGVLDYGAGNLRSVHHALEHCGAEVLLVERAGTLSQLTHLVLPGVGAMTAAMAFLTAAGLAEEVREFAAHGDRPVLGICLGMQMLATRGFEGGTVSGLNLIGGVVEPLPRSVEAGWGKTPRIGWMSVTPIPDDHSSRALLNSAQPDSKYYFAHGFHLIPDDKSVVRGVVAGDPVGVVAAVQCGNVFGTQFHPEKSGELGLALLRRFVTGFNSQEDGS